MLVRELQHLRASDGVFQKLKTIGEACRASLNESLRANFNWAMRHAQQPYFCEKNLLRQVDLL